MSGGSYTWGPEISLVKTGRRKFSRTRGLYPVLKYDEKESLGTGTLLLHSHKRTEFITNNSSNIFINFLLSLSGTEVTDLPTTTVKHLISLYV